MPYADPEKQRAWARNRKRQHRTEGKCLRCYVDSTTYYCFRCAVHRSALKRKQRQARKQAQV